MTFERANEFLTECVLPDVTKRVADCGKGTGIVANISPTSQKEGVRGALPVF